MSKFFFLFFFLSFNSYAEANLSEGIKDFAIYLKIDDPNLIDLSNYYNYKIKNNNINYEIEILSKDNQKLRKIDHIYSESFLTDYEIFYEQKIINTTNISDSFNFVIVKLFRILREIFLNFKKNNYKNDNDIVYKKITYKNKNDFNRITHYLFGRDLKVFYNSSNSFSTLQISTLNPNLVYSNTKSEYSYINIVFDKFIKVSDINFFKNFQIDTYSKINKEIRKISYQVDNNSIIADLFINGHYSIDKNLIEEISISSLPKYEQISLEYFEELENADKVINDFIIKNNHLVQSNIKISKISNVQLSSSNRINSLRLSSFTPLSYLLFNSGNNIYFINMKK